MVGLLILVMIQLVVYFFFLGVYYNDYLDWGRNYNGTPKTGSSEYKVLKSFKHKWQFWKFCVPFYPLWQLGKMGVKSLLKMKKDIKDL